MLLYTPKENLDQFMYEFNKTISYGLRSKSDRINRMFGGRYKWCVIQSNQYFLNCYRYVYQNPLRAGIVQHCEDYPFSTFHYKAKGKMFVVPLHDRLGFADGYKVAWMNRPIKDTEVRAVRNGLYRSILNNLKDDDRRMIPPAESLDG